MDVKISGDIVADTFAKEIKEIEKSGKKKNWIGGKDGLGHNLRVSVIEIKNMS